MSNHHHSFSGALLALFLLAFAPQAGAVTDFDADGYDDVWQRRYGVTLATFLLAGDNDGDGVSNQKESIAGSDPGNPNDGLAASSVTRSGSNLVLSVATKNQKRYRLQSSDAPDAPTWTDEGAVVVGDGTVKTFNRTISGDHRFFRVSCSDADTDLDGISDYAEALTGTNPALATSPGNASGGAATDFNTLRSLLSVTAAAVTPEAVEKEATQATVRLTRSFGTMPLTLSFDKGGASDGTKGSASPADYTFSGATTTSVSFANGATTTDILVAAVLDAAAEVPETLKLTFKLPGVAASATSPNASVLLKDAAVVTGNRRLYVAYLGREAGVTTTATGIATALVEGDNDTARVSLTFSNLSSVQNTAYVRVGSSLEVQVIPNGQPTGFPWPIRAKQFLLTDQAMLDALANGQLFMSVSSANYSSGEIRGTFALADGSIADPPAPPAPAAYNSAEFPNLAVGGVTNNPTLDRDIARFLQQCTYGPTPESIQEVRDLITANGNDMIAGYTAWINQQMNLAQTPSPSLMKLTQAADTEEFIIRGNKPSTAGNDPQFGGNSFVFNATTRTFVAAAQHQNNHPFHNNRRREWWTLVLNSRDQLRQRMAMALHEIVVIGENDNSIQVYHYGTANYWDTLAVNAFGPYRTILQEVTYSPQMGVYLSHLKNEKQTGSISPDENYAREIMQLFTIGLVLRHDNGSLKLDPDTALPIPTYDQGDITELARVMTGLSFSRYHPGGTGTETATGITFTQGNGNRFWQGSWTNDLRMFSASHDFNEYTAYTGLPLPSGVTSASKILFRGKAGQTAIPIRTQSDANGNADITNAHNALAGNQAATSSNGHPTTPVFISRLLIQRFTTANPSAGYLYRVTQVYKQTKGNLGDVLKAILLDHEARSLSIADSTATVGKPKEPLLHYAAMLRALKCSTGTPLANLNTMPVTFTAAQSWITTPYETTELNKFPAGTRRFRLGNTDGTLAQSPQDAPSVFNWFLPDYVLPGPLAAAGLVAPEFQVMTESNVVNIVNEHYATLFTSIPPANTVKPGRGLDDFLNLSQYQTATNGALTVPAYARPFDAGTNPTGVGYFSAASFDSTPGGTETVATINNQLDNILPDYDDLTTLYTNTYNQKLIDLYAPNPVPAAPTNADKNQAHDAATLVVLDQCDLLLAAGFLKANFGSLPLTTASPRKSIVDALQASPGIGSRTTHTDAINNGFLINAQLRAKNIAFLVLTSPQALILK